MEGLTSDNRKVIAICSATGGLGKTAITVNLAIYLATRFSKVSLVDADIQFGDLAMSLNLDIDYTIKDLAEQNDIANIQQYVTSHMSGIQLLAAPKRPEQADLIGQGTLSSAINALKRNSDIVLVETQPGFTNHSLEVMEQADLIIVVTTPQMACLKNTKLMIETLDALEYKDKTRLIVNQTVLSSVIQIEEIPNLTQMDVFFTLPYDPEKVSYSLDVGMPVFRSHPDIEFSNEIEKLAKKMFVIGRDRPTKKPSSRSIFSLNNKRTRWNVK